MVFNTIKRKFPLIAIHAYSKFSHKLFTARCPMETYRTDATFYLSVVRPETKYSRNRWYFED